MESTALAIVVFPSLDGVYIGGVVDLNSFFRRES